MARMGRRLPRSLLWIWGAGLSGFRRSTWPALMTQKRQIRRPSTREPETPPLPSWLGSFVGFSDMRVQRQPLEKKQQPGAGGDIVAQAEASVGGRRAGGRAMGWGASLKQEVI